jgi:hypothetical protein
VSTLAAASAPLPHPSSKASPHLPWHKFIFVAPPKRTRRAERRQRLLAQQGYSSASESASDSDEGALQENTEASRARRRHSEGGRQRSHAHWSAFLPNAWILKHTSEPFPYTPQIGDEVMYFKQGHRAYMEFAEAQSLHDFKCVCSHSLQWPCGSLFKVTPGPLTFSKTEHSNVNLSLQTISHSSHLTEKRIAHGTRIGFAQSSAFALLVGTPIGRQSGTRMA